MAKIERIISNNQAQEELSSYQLEDAWLWHHVTKTISPLNCPSYSKMAGQMAKISAKEKRAKTLAAGGALGSVLVPELNNSKNIALPLVANQISLKPALPSQSAHLGIPRAIFDQDSYRKIAQGRRPLDAKLDLHNFNEQEAYNRLASFLAQAYEHGKRYVLVITGRGSSPGSSAVLKQKVPRWLQLPNFQIWVSVFKEASRSHGGEGALYVRLRRDN